MNKEASEFFNETENKEPFKDVPLPPPDYPEDSKANSVIKKVNGNGKKSLAVIELLERDDVKKQLSLALPSHMDIGRFIRIAVTLCKNNDALSRCTPLSVCGAIMTASELGLDLSNNLGHAYIIPFKDKAQFMLGYRGMIDLAWRSNKIKSIYSHEVHENDQFSFQYGINQELFHVPSLTDRGVLIAVYAIAKTINEGNQMVVMGKGDVDSVRNKAKSDKIWGSNYIEMAKKTAIRRLFKYLPVSVEVQKAAYMDEMVDSGVDQNNEVIIDV